MAKLNHAPGGDHFTAGDELRLSWWEREGLEPLDMEARTARGDGAVTNEESSDEAG